MKQSGFSLVELAIVILIMGLVLGGLAMPLSVQRENARIREARDQMKLIEDAIHGYAISNGRLPCPATPASNGAAAANVGSCIAQHGFIPATTLGLSGARNNDNLLLDKWGAPVRYSVSASDSDSNGQWDLTTVGEMQNVTISSLMPDLVVCSTSTGTTATACGSANSTLTDTAPFIVYSLGEDWAGTTSADQMENIGGTIGGGASGQSYTVNLDGVFVTRDRSELSGAEYDDLVIWSSPNLLYKLMLEAGQLP